MYLNSHNLETETDRHNNVLLNFCKRDLEDEFHFVCPHFEDIFVKKISKSITGKGQMCLNVNSY